MSFFRANSHAGPNGAQAQHHHQQNEHELQLHQEQRGDPAAATLGALPAVATPKCWAVVQTPLETLYDDDEEDSEDSGYFNQLGTTAITPIYSETEQRGPAAVAVASTSGAARSGALPADESSGPPGRGAGTEGRRAGLGASSVPQHSRSEPHSLSEHNSSQGSVLQRTMTQVGQASAGTGETSRLGVSILSAQTKDATAAAGPQRSGSTTSARRPLLRLKTSSSVPNIQSHFKNRTLLRRPRSRNSSKEDGLQRETAFWGGDLFSDGFGDDNEDHQLAGTGKLSLLRKETYEPAVRACGPAPGGVSISTTSSGVNSRAPTSPLRALLFAGGGEACNSSNSSRARSCEEVDAVDSAWPSSRVTSAGAAISLRTSSTLSTQQQQLLTPRSQQEDGPPLADRQDWPCIPAIESPSTQPQEILPASSRHVESEGRSLYCAGSGNQSPKNHLGGPHVKVEHIHSKDLQKGGVPLLRRSLFHPFRKHISVSEGAHGGSCPDFRTAHNTYVGNSPASCTITGGRDSSRKHQLLPRNVVSGKAAGPGRTVPTGLPPLPYQQRHCRSGGDLPSAATNANTVPTTSTTSSSSSIVTSAALVVDRSSGDVVDIRPPPSSGQGPSATTGPATDMSSASSAVQEPPTKTSASRKEAATVSTTTRPLVGDVTKKEEAPTAHGIAHGSATTATTGENTVKPNGPYKPLIPSHQLPRSGFRTKGRNTPAAAGAAAATAMHAAGFATGVVSPGAAFASMQTGLASPPLVTELRNSSTTSSKGQDGATTVSGGGSGVVLPCDTRGAEREGGVAATWVSAFGSVAATPAAAEGDISSTSVCNNSNMSNHSSCVFADGGGAIPVRGASLPGAGVADVTSNVVPDDSSRGNGTNTMGTNNGGAGRINRSASISTLSKKLSIRALKLRGSAGNSGVTGSTAAASPAATLASTPASVASSSNSIAPQTAEHDEGGKAVTSDYTVKRAVRRSQPQTTAIALEQPLMPKQQGHDDALHSVVRAFETLDVSPVSTIVVSGGNVLQGFYEGADAATTNNVEEEAASTADAFANRTKQRSSMTETPPVS